MLGYLLSAMTEIIPAEPKEFTRSYVVFAYCVGLFDGEGCIGMYKVKKPRPGSRWRYRVSLRVGMTGRDALARMHAQFGAGTLRTYKLRQGRKQSWMWFCGARN